MMWYEKYPCSGCCNEGCSIIVIEGINPLSCKKPDGDGNHWIPAIMIDENHQGKGYGKAAMKKLIEPWGLIRQAKR
ncbi:GNAT family N-acetyltransferase [Paenibacillus sp. Soil766]|uniref:GNAT family N-acetyltransferase n=1 Tax=Paenibacillus sp. Soil766 TaxID=1736404 RepID=UPI001F262714|nr:GNAT family N-acetyltransferase [Paenibacillus sp. Soil766]